MIGNNGDNINMHLSDGLLSSYTKGNRSTLHVKLDLDDTNNAHTGTGFEQIAYTFTNDCGETSEDHTDTYGLNYNVRVVTIYTIQAFGYSGDDTQYIDHHDHPILGYTRHGPGHIISVRIQTLVYALIIELPSQAT
jgi:hypothetical protein